MSRDDAGALERVMAAERRAMVLVQLELRGIRDARVLDAMGEVPRHRFVPRALWPSAYADHPLPIGAGQTISQPFMVAYVAEALGLATGARVLEVGSGSGYLAAILARMGLVVHGLELEEALYRSSRQILDALGFGGLNLRHGDGRRGWPEAAPFDAVVLSCACETLPAARWDQLRPGGVAIFPEGPAGGVQELVRLEKAPEGMRREHLLDVCFVPLRKG